MPTKIRKRSETGGLNQPDQVMTRLQTTYALLDKYKYHIVFGFAGIVVILLAISWWVGYREDRRQELAGEFFEAFKYFEAPLGETAPPGSELPAFKTAAEKFGKAAEELTKFIDDNSSADIATTARLALASAKMELGDYEAAYGILGEFAEDAPSEALLPLIHENLGFACLKLGKMDEATQHFTKMKESATDSFLTARALMHLGDMVNPGSSVAALKDAAKAKEYYDEALTLLPEEQGLEGAVPDPSVALTRQEIELRLSLLKVS